MVGLRLWKLFVFCDDGSEHVRGMAPEPDRETKAYAKCLPVDE